MAGRLFWGPKMWSLFHTFSANISLSEDNKCLWNHFLKVSVAAMNCNVCQAHFSASLKGLNMSTMTRRDLEIWIFENHNTINKSTNKEVYLIESLDTYKIQPDDRIEKKKKTLETINLLAEYFLRFEHQLQIPAGTTLTWKQNAMRFHIFL
jgi:hypothetical protein